MRANFNKTGTSFHLILQPHVLPALSLSVPQGRANVFVNGVGVVFSFVDYEWLMSQVWRYIKTNQIDPTHLPVFIGKNVGLTKPHSPNPFVFAGVHWAGIPSFFGGGPVAGNG